MPPTAHQQNLIEKVTQTLVAAGLPLGTGVSTRYQSGVETSVEPDEEYRSGIHVRWHTHPSFRSAVVDANARQDWDNPLLRRNKDIHVAMSQAMLAILSSAGFAVTYTDNDLAPHDLWVTAAPDRSV